MVRTVTDELLQWPAIREQFRNQANLGLLLGNGASQAIWRRFSYRSLFEIACNANLAHALSAVDQAFFREMATVNFEAVLSALATTRMVCGHLKKEFGDVEERYNSIRLSLIEAVRAVHVPFGNVPLPTMQQLGRILNRYRYVYSTNYDLLPYWAMMATNEELEWKDFMWGMDQSFDPSNCHEWDDDSTNVIYLHGALHIYHDLFGNTKKKRFDEDSGADLLTQFDAAGEWIPLFVSEGDSKDKLRSIRRNDYLSFAYWKLCRHRGPLVVFGNALNDPLDRHIVDAIRGWQTRRIAVSIYPEMTGAEIIAEKNRLSDALPGKDLLFFDSTTHPLGHPALRIQ